MKDDMSSFLSDIKNQFQGEPGKLARHKKMTTTVQHEFLLLYSMSDFIKTTRYFLLNSFNILRKEHILSSAILPLAMAGWPAG